MKLIRWVVAINQKEAEDLADDIGWRTQASAEAHLNMEFTKSPAQPSKGARMR